MTVIKTRGRRPSDPCDHEPFNPETREALEEARVVLWRCPEDGVVWRVTDRSAGAVRLGFIPDWRFIPSWWDRQESKVSVAILACMVPVILGLMALAVVMIVAGIVEALT